MTEGPAEFAMRSRVGRTSSDGERTFNDVVLLERKLKPGDTLNKLSIQYSVNVADIKRVNNLVSDVDFGALTSVKIPISKMRYALGVSTSSDDDDHIIDIDERVNLLHESRSRDPSVEEIFHKTDSTIAQVREALPESRIPGSFHFVDAKPPDTGCSVWALLAGVVVMFMVIPLVLTFYEEAENSENAAHHR